MLSIKKILEISKGKARGWLEFLELIFRETRELLLHLRYIHGVGAKRSEDICTDLKIDPSTRVSNLTNDEVAQIRKYIEANFQS